MDDLTQSTKIRLGVVDLRLLLELDKSCRESVSNIAKKSRVSQQLASYKIKNFLDSGLLLSFNSFIDYAKFGYLNFRVYFKINYFSTERFNSLLKELQSHSTIVEIMECGGKYDLIAVFASLNPSEFNKRLKELMGKNPSQLKNYVILTTVVTHYYDRAYLTPLEKETVNIFRDPEADVIIGGDRSTTTVNKKEKSILNLIQADARLPSIVIGRKIKTDPKAVRRYIKNLRERGIIKLFRPAYNVQNIGFIVNKILLKYHNLSVEEEEELLTFCKFNPNIVELIKVFGEWDLELTVETKSREEFRRVYMSIREKFENIISDFESFPVFKTHKKTFLPATMFYRDDAVFKSI